MSEITVYENSGKSVMADASLLSVPLVNRPLEAKECSSAISDVRNSLHCSHVFPASLSKVCVKCGVASLPLSMAAYIPTSTILDRNFINETLAAIKHNTSTLKTTGDALERQYFAIESINAKNANEIHTWKLSGVPKKIQKPSDPPLFPASDAVSANAKDSGAVPRPVGHASKKDTEAVIADPRDASVPQAMLWNHSSSESSEINKSSVPIGVIWNSDLLSPSKGRELVAEGVEDPVGEGQLVNTDQGNEIGDLKSFGDSKSGMDITAQNSNILAGPNNSESVTTSEEDSWLLVKFWPHRMAGTFKTIYTNLKNRIESCNFDVRCRFSIRRTKELATTLGATIAEANRKLTWINERQTHFYMCLEQVRFSSFEDLSIVLEKLVEKNDDHPSGAKNSQIMADSISNLEAREINLIVKLRDLKMASEDIYRTWFPRNKALVSKCKAQLSRMHGILLDDAAVAIQSKFRYHREQVAKRDSVRPG